MNTYKSLPRITPNGITLMLGSSTGMNINASLSHAKELVKSLPSGSVLYLNTVQDTRSMFTSARKHGLKPDGNGVCYLDGDYRKVIYILNVTRGDLHKWRAAIKEYLYMGYIQYVMVNSWEFSSKNSRYREEALFFIKEMTEGIEGGFPPVHALIYAEEPSSEPLAQKIQRNGFGKLTGLVQTIHSISVHENFIDTSSIDELLNLPEVKDMAEIPVMSHGIEDDPGVTYEEILKRIAARTKQPTTKEWYDNKVKKETEVSGDGDQVLGVRETEPTIDNRPSTIDSPTIDIPVTSIEELRSTPETISKMPIHLNSYSPIKAPVLRPSRTGNVGKTMIKK